MTKREGDLAAVLAAESDAIEEAERFVDDGAPLPDHVKVTRGGKRTRVLQVRLNDIELARIETIASARDLPTSTVARGLLLAQLAATEGSVDPADPAAALEAVEGTVREIRRQLTRL